MISFGFRQTNDLNDRRIIDTGRLTLENPVDKHSHCESEMLVILRGCGFMPQVGWTAVFVVMLFQDWKCYDQDQDEGQDDDSWWRGRYEEEEGGRRREEGGGRREEGEGRREEEAYSRRIDDGWLTHDKWHRSMTDGCWMLESQKLVEKTWERQSWRVSSKALCFQPAKHTRIRTTRMRRMKKRRKKQKRRQKLKKRSKSKTKKQKRAPSSQCWRS